MKARASQTLLVNRILALALVVASVLLMGSARQVHNYVPTGWILIAACFFLALFNVRKKLPFLRLARASTWLQLHTYIGFAVIPLFAIHVGFAWPTGTMEGLMTMVFFLVVVSGLFGLLVTRMLPQRLARRGEEVIYERIPGFRNLMNSEAEAIALASVGGTKSKVLVDFYALYLRPFLSGPRGFWTHVMRPSDESCALRAEMDELETCLGDEERTVLDQLRERVRIKDDLDFHHANQSVLKYWFFIHIPFTYSLMILVLMHVVVVYAFGAAR
jgi:hypothetical protein